MWALSLYAAAAAAFSPQPFGGEISTRRAALVGGLAAVTMPSVANADAASIWTVRKTNQGPPDAAKKCNVDKPCVAGAGLKWDPKSLGVDAAAKRSFMKGPNVFAPGKYK